MTAIDMPPPAQARGGPASAGVATGNAATTAAAVEVLHEGGNAIDAAVAAGFASTVCEPGLTSLAGGGFAVVVEPNGEASSLDFFAAAPGLGREEGWHDPATITVVYPSASQDFRVGPAAAAVPGVLAGFLELHRRWGRLPISAVAGPAVRLAGMGARMDAAQAYILTLIEDIARHTPSAQRMFAPDGELLAEGDLLHDEELAGFLSLIADGEVLDYRSAAFADPLLAMAAQGCHITAEDLQTYRPLWRAPLVSGPAAGWTLVTNPAPAYGGAIVARALGNLAGSSPAALVAALEEATDHVKTGPAATAGTTHISVVDADGLVVSMTTTNGAGGGVLIPTTGIHLNNMLGEDDLLPAGIAGITPGERLRSMMAPSVLRSRDGGLIALGSGGSARIRTAVATVIAGVRDRGVDLAEAVAAPRVHLDAPGHVQAEHGFTADDLAGLRQDFDVNEWDRTDFFFGGVNAVQRMPDGQVLAVADQRRGGSVAIVEP